jgi:hypothetical protein
MGALTTKNVQILRHATETGAETELPKEDGLKDGRGGVDFGKILTNI